MAYCIASFFKRVHTITKNSKLPKKMTGELTPAWSKLAKDGRSFFINYYRSNDNFSHFLSLLMIYERNIIKSSACLSSVQNIKSQKERET